MSKQEPVNLFQPAPAEIPDQLFKPLAALKLKGRWATGENQKQLIRIVDESIQRIMSNRAYFREENVITGTINIAQKEMNPEDIEDDAFDIFIRYTVSQVPLISIGKTGFLTTPEMADRERAVIALAGDEDGKHMLPIDIVADAIDRKRAPLRNGKGLSDEKMSKVLKEIDLCMKKLDEKIDVDVNLENLKKIISDNLPQEKEGAGLSDPQTETIIKKIQSLKKLSGDRTLILSESQYYDVKKIIDSTRSGVGISDEQEMAVLATTRSPRRVTVIEGTAGAGKSYTMEAVKDAYTRMGYQVLGTALSWNAAKVLETSAQLDNSVATEGLVNQMLEARAAGTDYFRKPTLLIVDEAGMLGTRHMFHLLDESYNSKFSVKVVLTGDSLQLSPVDAGNSLQAIVEYHGTTRINEIRRQRQESHRQAVYSFSERFAGQGLYTYLHQEALSWCKNKTSLIDMVVRDYISYRYAYPGKQALVLALSNDEVHQINQRIRQAHKKAGLIEAHEIKVKVTDGRQVWETGFSVGDEVVMRGNDKNMIVYEIETDKSFIDESDWIETRIGAFNRNAGVIRAIRRSSKTPGSYDIIIDLHGDRPGRVILNTQKFKHSSKSAFPVTHNFATTIYASQGQTVHQVFLVDSPRIDFRLAYVGMSRHKEGVQIYINETEIHERLDSMRGKSTPLKQRVAQVRGEEVKEIPIQLGQYNRSEMIQAIAKSWSKNSMNLTAMMFEREKRLGDKSKKSEPKPEDLSRLEARFSDESKIIDFLPELNRPYPLVDMKKLFQLPDPVQEHELISPSEVEKSNLKNKSSEMLLEEKRPKFDSSLPDLKQTPNNTLFSKMKDWWSGQGEQESLVLEIPEKEFISPFEQEEQEKEKEEGLLKKFIKLAVKTKVEMPFLPLEKSQGVLSEDESTFSFENVKQTPNSATPPDDYLKNIKGKFWAVGKWGEPRILARNGQGQIVSRYRLDGKCVVGEGFPPMILNPHASPETSIMIVPGPKEWLLTQHHMLERHRENPEKIPHLIWAAHDADWGWIVKAMVSTAKPVIVARSRVDPYQLEWSKAIKKQLEEHGVHCKIIPEPEEPTPSKTGPKI